VQYWIVRGDPKQNEDFVQIRAGTSATWHTKVPPRGWQAGDRLLFWASYPRSELLALGEFLGETGEVDDDGEKDYRLQYLTDVVPRPLRQDELRADPVLAGAIFLKRGPATSVLRSSISEGEHIYRLFASRNISIKGTWPDLELSETALSDVDQSAIEGAPKLVAHLRRERNRGLVDAKRRDVLKRNGKLECEVCSFDFKNKYGALGEGFCEVHHLNPLSDGPEAVETRLIDLAIVCSNCHRMIHRAEGPLSLSELRIMLR
jgi:hypothetical protein